MLEIVDLAPQQTTEERPHRIKLANWLQPGDSIASIDATTLTGIAQPAGKPDPLVEAGANIVFWLGGGTSGTTATGYHQFTTASGEVMRVNFQLSIADLPT